MKGKTETTRGGVERGIYGGGVYIAQWDYWKSKILGSTGRKGGFSWKKGDFGILGYNKGG